MLDAAVRFMQSYVVWCLKQLYASCNRTLCDAWRSCMLHAIVYVVWCLIQLAVCFMQSYVVWCLTHLYASCNHKCCVMPDAAVCLRQSYTLCDAWRSCMLEAIVYVVWCLTQLYAWGNRICCVMSDAAVCFMRSYMLCNAWRSCILWMHECNGPLTVTIALAIPEHEAWAEETLRCTAAAPAAMAASHSKGVMAAPSSMLRLPLRTYDT